MAKYRVVSQGGAFFIECKYWLFGWCQVFDIGIDEVRVPRCYLSQPAAEDHVRALMAEPKVVYP